MIKNRIDRKYFIIELCFFLFICYISSIISDMEYSAYEEKDISGFTKSLETRLVWGSFSFAFYATYYWGFLKRFVFKKQAGYIILSIVFFILLSHIYNRYVMNWCITQLGFLSESLRTGAQKELDRPGIYFIVSYTLNRIVLIIIGFTFLVRSLQQDEQMKAMKEQHLLAELNYLKARLQPHFFFNTLNNIYALAISQSRDTAPMIARLSEMMRYILYEADRPLVLLSQEIDFLNNYIAIEKIRYPDHISIHCDIQGVKETDKIAPLLLLPFIENAFKHGAKEEVEQGYINIVICRTEDELTLHTDNSKPRSAGKKESKGIGLENAKKRLDLLYGDHYEWNVTEDESRYTMDLTLKMI